MLGGFHVRWLSTYVLHSSVGRRMFVYALCCGAGEGGALSRGFAVALALCVFAGRYMVLFAGVLLRV